MQQEHLLEVPQSLGAELCTAPIRSSGSLASELLQGEKRRDKDDFQ